MNRFFLSADFALDCYSEAAFCGKRHMSGPAHIIAHQLASGDAVLGIALGLLFVAAVWFALVVAGRLRRGGWAERAAGLAWQLGALLGLEQAYEYTRGRIPQQQDVALLHAYRVLDFEWKHGFFVEQRLEHFFLQFHLLLSAISLFYVLSHAVVTIAVLAWIYLARREYYPFTRNMFMLVTAIALVAFYLYPIAPPRLLPNYGFVDPTVLYHFVSEGGAQPGSYTYNPYAAMPSLHVAYALIIAWSTFRAARSVPVRVVAILYPIAMSAAVVISANHWLLDVAGALATVVAARLLLAAIGGMHRVVRFTSLRLAVVDEARLLGEGRS
jgi:hypothetical protein